MHQVVKPIKLSVSGLLFACNVHDQTFSNDFDESFVVAEIFKRPLDVVSKYCFSKYAEAMFQGVVSRLEKRCFQQRCEASGGYHLHRIVGHGGWITSSEILRQFGCKLIQSVAGKKLQKHIFLRCLGVGHRGGIS